LLGDPGAQVAVGREQDRAAAGTRSTIRTALELVQMTSLCALIAAEQLM